MRPLSPVALALAVGLLAGPVAAQPARVAPAAAEPIPLPEHPRPDWQRAEWSNLNGRWQFAFDARDEGERLGWHRADGAAMPAAHRILVPFSWGSPASGVPDSADVAWYARSVQVPAAWRGRRVFLVVGASDWRTTAWLDGRALGTHQGGYTPFAFELTAGMRPGVGQRLALRVDDRAHPFKLEGKQGYGRARGPWQTVYLEARGDAPLAHVHVTPEPEARRARVVARLLEPAPRALTLRLAFADTAVRPVSVTVPRGAREVRVDVPVPRPRLWRLDDPYLYAFTASLGAPGLHEDRVESYFGMRTVTVRDLPGTRIPYVALNGEPVYLQLALDQAYHPTGWYTFPTDSILRDEILRARQIGLNGLREHIKVEAPRKLYWADRLGMLIMADVPNWWGEPDSTAFAEHDHAMRGMIARDFNHPSVFSWVTFNETWGLRTKGAGGRERYLPATQAKVSEVQQLAKRLDPTRLVEDNSVCCGAGHTTTDLNTWHEYLAGWQWPAHVARLADSTFEGSPWNFERPWRQGRQPMFNSEFGNVWGYEGSTGDVDYSWDYHQAIDVFRRTPKMAGWLYTEHHDVVNEWNGYWRFDRSNKETGVGDLVPGMTLRDFHAPYYVAVGTPGTLSQTVRAGETVAVPLWASFLTPPRAAGDSLTLHAELWGVNAAGERRVYGSYAQRVPHRGWMSEALAPLAVRMPGEPAVAVLAVRLLDAGGTVLHHNFATFVVPGTLPDTVTLADGRRARTARVDVAATSAARWSEKAWTASGGRKVNGAGSGFVEYRLPWPRGLRAADVAGATFLVEASAKRLLGKDLGTPAAADGDYMRGGGLQDPGRNPNAYPMTGERKYPSAVTVRFGDVLAARHELPDDPADSRGILSWHAQAKGDPKQRRLDEAGSYGELLRVAVPDAALVAAERAGALVVRLEVDAALPGGLAIYGREFGRFPVDPTVLFVLRSAGAAREGGAAR